MIRGKRFPAGRWAAALVTVALLTPLVAAWWPLGEPAPTSSGIAWSSLVASVLVAVSVATLATVLGLVLAVPLTLGDLRGRSLWCTLLLLPLLAPPTVWALAQVYCFGAGGLLERLLGDGWRPLASRLDAGHYLSTVLVLAQIHAPLAMLILARGLGRLHRAGLEAARLALPRRELALWILRAARPELLAAWLLTAALALGNFAVPHVMQCRLYPIEIYMRNANYLDQVGALRYSLPLVALTLLAVVALTLVERRSLYSATSTAPQTSWRFGRGAWPLVALLSLYVGITTALPIAAMVFECRSLSNFLSAVRAAAPETENMLLIAGGAALLAALAGQFVGSQLTGRGGLVFALGAMVPLGVPTLALGLAYLRFYNTSGLLDVLLLADTSLLAMLGLAARAWPFATRIAAAGHARLAPEWSEAADLGRLSFWRRWRWIRLPLVAEHAAAAAIVAFVLSAGDVEIGQLLCAPGSGTLSLRLFTFLHFGPTHVAASLALLQLIVVTVPVWIYFLLTDRWLQVV